MKKILSYIKSHILISSIIGVVLICSIIVTSIVINNFNKKDVDEKDINNKYNTLFCSNEYTDGEKVNLEFIYDNNGKKLKKHILNHTEIDLSEEDELSCNSFNLLSGITCSFDKTEEPYKYTIEFNIDDFDNESRKMINDYGNYDYLLSLSMSEAKKYLIEDENYGGMICKIIDENGNVISEETNIDNEKYVGFYYDTTYPSSTDVYILELKENGTYNAFVNFGISSSELSGTYTIDDNILSLSSSNDGENYKIDKTTFVIKGNSLTFKSGGISDETAKNIGCATGNFDCSEVKVLYKK